MNDAGIALSRRGNKYQVSEFGNDGYLRRPELWTEDIARQIAGSLGIADLGEGPLDCDSLFERMLGEERQITGDRQSLSGHRVSFGTAQCAVPNGICSRSMQDCRSVEVLIAWWLAYSCG